MQNADNNHQGPAKRSLRSRLTITLFVLLQVLLAQPGWAAIISLEEQAALDAINAARLDRGFGAFSLNDSLTAAAEHHSLDMAANGAVSNQNSDGTSLFDTARTAGFDLFALGALVASTGVSADGNAAAQQWLDSPPHADIIFSASFSQFGIAAENNGPGSFLNYWTLFLGGPSTLIVPPDDGDDGSTGGDPTGGDPTGGDPTEGVPIDGGTGSVKEVLVNLFNGLRELVGLGPLTRDPNLETAADAHAADMSANGFFSHTGSDGSRFTDRPTAAGFTGFVFSELMATTSETDPYLAFEQWRNSDPHRDLMLANQIDSIGVGFAESGTRTLWSVTLGVAPATSDVIPVPEPPAFILMIAALAVSLMYRRKAWTGRHRGLWTISG